MSCLGFEPKVGGCSSALPTTRPNTWLGLWCDRFNLNHATPFAIEPSLRLGFQPIRFNLRHVKEDLSTFLGVPCKSAFLVILASKSSILIISFKLYQEHIYTIVEKEILTEKGIGAHKLTSSTMGGHTTLDWICRA
ncbi:hypothetical protein VNO77_34128 [Canavalia gladiata]|uniref:Uncharacterized protein n=1 Tax=Canavalia gladiata TaxID=3824 RepID=A0AAN9PZ00_CANGL